MNNNVVQLSSLDDQDDEYMEFLDSLREDVAEAVYLVKKGNDEIYVGSSYKDKRDLVVALYRLQGFIQNLLHTQEG